MRETLIVSSRGQITLPASLRKRFGIKGGDIMILEDQGDNIVLKAGIVVEIEQYKDSQIAQWDAEDELSKLQRKKILAGMKNNKK